MNERPLTPPELAAAALTDDRQLRLQIEKALLAEHVSPYAAAEAERLIRIALDRLPPAE